MTKPSSKLFLKAFCSLLLLCALALVLTWLLEFRYYSGDASSVADFMFSRPRVFLFNAVFMLLFLIITSALSGGIFRGAGLLSAIILIIGYIHINKFASRGTPLLPEDFQLASQAAALSKFVSIDGLINLAISVVAVLLIGEILERWTGHFFISVRAYRQSGASFLRRHLILPRLLAAFCAALLVAAGANLVMSYRNGRTTYVDFLDNYFIAWNQTYNYNDNGFLLGFIYNWGKFNLTEPEGYSEESIVAIRDHYDELAAADQGQNLAEADYNIVIILDESLIDPSSIEDFYPHSGGDPTPNLHALMSKYPSGYLFSPDYGGGTANIEFEMLTGLTNYWADTTPYTSLLPHLENITSIVHFANANAYTSSAIHAYNGSMYKRNIALLLIGFSDFIAEDAFTYRAHDGSSEYINDQSTYAEALQLLAQGGKQFLFIITMQNHTPYNSDTYAQNQFILDKAPSGDSSRKAQIETYYETIHSSDAYLGEFIAALDESEQKTVVMLFGDHAPGLFTELDSSSDATEFALSRLTPYFIYANFELPSNDDLPITTPNCLANTLFNTLGIKQDSLGYLLNDLCQAYPVLTARYFGETAPEYSASLQAYQLVTYDILGGKQYWFRP